MGIKFIDKFSLLHFSTGTIIYFWQVSFINWFIIHLFYEIITNTKWGIYFINNYSQWPGGTISYDTVINSIGDQFWAMMGYIFTYFYIQIFFNGSLKDDFIKN